MKIILIVAALSFGILFCPSILSAQESGGVGVISPETNSDTESAESAESADSEVPPGMEIKKVGGINFIVPKGAKLYKRGGITTMEGASAYSARRFDTIESRLGKLEESVKELKEEMTQVLQQ